MCARALSLCPHRAPEVEDAMVDLEHAFMLPVNARLDASTSSALS